MRGQGPALRAAWLALAVLVAGCSGGVIQSVDSLPPAPPGQGFLEIKCPTPGTELFVDDVFRGEVARFRQGVVPLPVGKYRVALKAQGHYAWYGKVNISGTPTRLQVALIPEVDRGPELQRQRGR